jgi:hypothetical protein
VPEKSGTPNVAALLCGGLREAGQIARRIEGMRAVQKNSND